MVPGEVSYWIGSSHPQTEKSWHVQITKTEYGADGSVSTNTTTVKQRLTIQDAMKLLNSIIMEEYI